MFQYSRELARKIDLCAPMSKIEIVSQEIDEFLASDSFKWMQIGQRYYEGGNDVLTAPRTAIGDYGRLTSVDNIADNRIAHNFCRELVDQKIQYFLAKQYSVQMADQDFGKAVEAELGDDFQQLLFKLTKDAINMGISWLHVYYDEDGRFKLKRCNSREMIPIWKDSEHKTLDAMIRIFDKVEYVAKKKTYARYAQLWTQEGVSTLSLKEGRWIETGPLCPHFKKRLPKRQVEDRTWNAIPFIPMKYNDEERPLISSLKPLIDNYDRVVSDTANAIQDQPNSILVLRNYDGQRLDEFRRNLAAYRAVKVSDDGGVEALQTPLSVDAVNTHLDRLRKDIYAIGRGVDTRAESFSHAASGIALQHRYAQLDLDCNGLEIQLNSTINSLLEFLKEHLIEKDPKFADCDTTVNFVFNRDILINEEAAIQMCKDSVGLISRATIAANHPWVKDINAEMEELSKCVVSQDNGLSSSL